MKISVITVVKNNAKEMLDTINSMYIQKSNDKLSLEWIVIDGVSEDGTIELIQKHINIIDVFISEKDRGIYDAMNRGISESTGDGLLFLNAGDLLIGDVLEGIDQLPIFLPVFYTDILGRFKKVKIRSRREGIPNCHQGIIFPRSDLRYSLNYNICSDYDYYLNHGFAKKIPFNKCSGYVSFSPGISSISYIKRDREIFSIRKKHFGISSAVIFEWRNFLKRLIRNFLHK